MRALLMHPDRDFDLECTLPWNASVVTQDLELNTLLRAMAGEDEFLTDIARRVLLSGLWSDFETILYRQEILKDCLGSPSVVRELYEVAVDAVVTAKKEWWWAFSGRSPSSMMHSSVHMLEMLLSRLRKLRDLTGAHATRFPSQAAARLFSMLRSELAEEYLAVVQSHLTALTFRKGVFLSAELGPSNDGANYVLREPPERGVTWFDRVFRRRSALTFYLGDRDEAGAQILSEIRHRGITKAATALAESAEHVVNFFKMLRAELAFYVCCLNLHDRLAAKGEPTCFPTPSPAGERRYRVRGLYDVCLSLHLEAGVVGNAVNADGRDLVVITGANQGGKSTFLRSVGLAQLMMQCGLFVGAEEFTADLCPALYTHYKREEDATMKSGKFDEELDRLSQIIDRIEPNAMVLFNESFAATNEREGSEIARQIVSALLERGIRVLYVTHLFDFARSMFERGVARTLFLRAERNADGTRTFRVVEGEPLETSYGEDLFREVFATDNVASGPQTVQSRTRTETE